MLYPKVVEVLRAGATRRAKEAAVTYLVVGVDQSTFAPWHENVRAVDVLTAREVARARGDAGGLVAGGLADVGPLADGGRLEARRAHDGRNRHGLPPGRHEVHA